MAPALRSMNLPPFPAAIHDRVADWFWSDLLIMSTFNFHKRNFKCNLISEKRRETSLYFAFLALSTSLAIEETHSSRAICYVKQIIIQNNEHIEELLCSAMRHEKIISQKKVQTNSKVIQIYSLHKMLNLDSQYFNDMRESLMMACQCITVCNHRMCGWITGESTRWEKC
jgi:hypothetical protein